MTEAKGTVEVIMLLPSKPAAKIRRQAVSVQTWLSRLVGLRQRKVSRGLSKLDKLSFSWQRAEGYIRSPNVYARYVCMFAKHVCMFAGLVCMFAELVCMYTTLVCMSRKNRALETRSDSLRKPSSI